MNIEILAGTAGNALTVPMLAFILVLILGERKLIRQMLAELEKYRPGEMMVNHIDTEASS